MMSILGWKDILRPIRDGYRHLFPAPDTGPTPEERERQRQLDRLKGFAYFDTIAQLETWIEADSDPLQRSNTPLLPRNQRKTDGEAKAPVLICHDYSGNYREYEAVQSACVNEESYTCEYLQYVDTFIYFSHKFVCVPPPTWTNCLHRNGVKVLGTILVEPQTKDAERLLQHTTSSVGSHIGLHFPLAKKLADIAKHYGFDGWLINIEKPFPNEYWNEQVLPSFLEQLRKGLGPERELIWYDALTDSNKIDYQNGLTQRNFAFSVASGSILTNYCWKESDAIRSKKLADDNILHPVNIFFGVDVWAQNSTELMHPRVTYPEKGGGGTNTGIAVAKVAVMGLSVGVFAPAWSFEHFPGHGRAVERVMWEGLDLPEHVDCSCGNTSIRHAPNHQFPIVRFAQQFAAGSESFFYTDFTRGFGKHEQEDDMVYMDKKLHSQLAAQSVLPNYISRIQNERSQRAITSLSYRLEDRPGFTQLVVDVQSNIAREISPNDFREQYMPLYMLDMPAGRSLKLKIVFQRCLTVSYVSIAFYIKLDSGQQHLSCPESEGVQSIEYTLQEEDTPYESNRLQELGVYVRAPHMNLPPTRVLEVREISIIPLSTSDISGNCSIDVVHFEHRNDSENGHWRLLWTFSDEREEKRKASGIPYSDITGPFSYFLVEIDGLSVGRVYALETILSDHLMNLLKSHKEMEVTVTGVGFDGRRLAANTTMLQI